MTRDGEIHLVVLKGARCHCGDSASHLMRCRKCRAVIARCGGHDRDIAREAREHCS